jgi:hypothetical protein
VGGEWQQRQQLLVQQCKQHQEWLLYHLLHRPVHEWREQLQQHWAQSDFQQRKEWQAFYSSKMPGRGGAGAGRGAGADGVGVGVGVGVWVCGWGWCGGGGGGGGHVGVCLRPTHALDPQDALLQAGARVKCARAGCARPSLTCRRLRCTRQVAKMINDAGETVDLYIPRKW